MDWNKILELIPVIAGVVNPAAGVTLGIIIAEGERIIAEKQAADPSLTREEIISQAQTSWEQDVKDAEALRNEGHE